MLMIAVYYNSLVLVLLLLCCCFHITVCSVFFNFVQASSNKWEGVSFGEGGEQVQAKFRRLMGMGNLTFITQCTCSCTCRRTFKHRLFVCF